MCYALSMQLTFSCAAQTQLSWRTPPSRSGWKCPASCPQSTWTSPSTPQRWEWAVWAAGRGRCRCYPQPSKSHWTLREMSRHVLTYLIVMMIVIVIVVDLVFYFLFSSQEFLVALRLQGATMRHYMTQTNHSWHEQVRSWMNHTKEAQRCNGLYGLLTTKRSSVWIHQLADMEATENKIAFCWSRNLES